MYYIQQNLDSCKIETQYFGDDVAFEEACTRVASLDSALTLSSLSLNTHSRSRRVRVTQSLACLHSQNPNIERQVNAVETLLTVCYVSQVRTIPDRRNHLKNASSNKRVHCEITAVLTYSIGALVLVMN